MLLRNSIQKTMNAVVLAMTCAMLSLAPQAVFGADATIVVQEDPASLKSVGVPTYVWKRKNDNAPRAIFVGLHGGCLHGRSFDAMAKQLAAQDVMFVSLDMRGYGKWYHNGYGTEEDKTFNYTRTIEDIRRLLTALRAQYPGVPVYPIGESLGANMSLVIGYRMPELVEGIILVSPYFVARKFVEPEMAKTAAQILLHPKTEVDMAPYLRTRLAHKAEYSLKQIKDPLGRDQQTVKELGQSMMLNWSGRRKVDDLNPKVAVLMIHGEKDDLCNPKGTQKAFRRVTTTNKKLVILPDAGHLIVEAPEVNKNALAALDQWVDEQRQVLSARKARATKPQSAAAVSTRNL
jgi:acylglycerol lipase